MRAALSSSQKKFLQSLVLEGSFKISHLLKELANLGKMDTAGDKSRKVLGIIIAISLLIAFASIFILIDKSNTLLVIIEAIFLPVAIASIVLFFVLKKGDLDNNLRLFIIPFLGVLREEMHNKAKINLSLSAKNLFDKTYLFDKKQLPPRSNGFVTDTRTISYYKQTPFKGNVTLSDNTDLVFEFINHGQEVNVKKVTSRKTKYKTKYKKAIRLNISLSFPKSTYTLNGAHNTGIPVVISETEQAIKVKGKVVFKGLEKESTAPLNTSIRAIQQLYKVVKPI